MIDYPIFHILFLVQIVMMSYYFPNAISQRMEHVLRNYPAAEYPKLYPQPVDFYLTGQNRYRLINHIIAALGLIILGATIHFDYSNSDPISKAIAGFYYMLQCLPYLLLELSGYSQFKQMRQAIKTKTKTATILPRGLFDFVSPVFVWIAVSLNLFYIGLVGYIHNFDFRLEAGLSSIIPIILMNTFFAFIIYWNLNSKRLNPHQESSERLNDTKFTLRSIVYISILSSTFLTLEVVNAFLEFELIGPAFVTLFLVIVGYLSIGSRLSQVKIDDINFDVYRADILKE